MIESILQIFSSIPGEIYTKIYYNLILVLCLFTAFRLVPSGSNSLPYQKAMPPVVSILLTLFLILFLGMRPLTDQFADTWLYAFGYDAMINGNATSYVDASNGEWLWNSMMYLFARSHIDVHFFFLFVEVFYLGLMLLCCWLLFPNNTFIALLFFIGSYSTYSYGINGIRNGLACSVVIMSVALTVTGRKPERIAGLLLALLAIAIHRSTALPIVALYAAVFLIKSPKYAIYFWIASIFISLIAGTQIGNFFSALDFDDRMASYFQGQSNTEVMSSFSHTGFRWDFLLYSSVPVLWSWYLTMKRNFFDRGFNIIAVTYILANSFWIMVIRAAFSNRFAYLSWFLYPLVICYPLLRFNIWPDQDRKTAYILMAYFAFSYFMFLIGR